jgi:hypothetical protein
MTQPEGKVVSQMLFGGILLGLSVLLIIPSSIGIAEYNNRLKPVVMTPKDHDKEKQLKAYEGVQIFILVVALIALMISIYLMATSSKGKMYIEATKKLLKSKNTSPVAAAVPGPAAVSLGGAGRRQLSEFRLH